MVNDAVRISLAEDAEDLAAFADRTDDPSVAFDKFVTGLRRRGKTWSSHQTVRGQGA